MLRQIRGLIGCGRHADVLICNLYCMTSFIQNSRKYKLIYSDRKEISSCLGIGVQGEMRDYQGQKENFVVHGYVYRLDYGVLIYRSLANLICAVCCMSIIPHIAVYCVKEKKTPQAQNGVTRAKSP